MDILPESLGEIVSSVLSVWPEHKKFIARGIGSLGESELIQTESIAKSVRSVIAGELESYASDYRTMCQNLNEEEYFFRRNGRYRFSSYAQVADFVYHNDEYMRAYMRGLLVSQVLWTNHIGTTSCFKNDFLEGLGSGLNGLEIGPGHGLFTHCALQTGKFVHYEGWDISESSLDETARTLQALGHGHTTAELHVRDAAELAGQGQKYDAITISEVLEHTEDPQSILNQIYAGLNVGGMVFVNVPLNCPAIDHIFLYQSEEEIRWQVEKSGLQIRSLVQIPVTGFTLERARRMKATISVALTACRES